MLGQDDFYFGSNGMLASGLAWMLFSETGLPGFYMMYRDLSDDEDDLLK